MDKDFWSSRWALGEIGFHRDEISPDLAALSARFLSGGPHRVLVPLSGKSRDLAWMASQGHGVVGVELVETAVREWMKQEGVDAPLEEREGLLRVEAEGVTVICGDFLSLLPTQVGTFDRAWDRGAMVALPEDMRPAYVAALRGLLRPGGQLLLSTFAYDQSVHPGPPWSVSAEEVDRRYGDWSCSLVADSDEIEPRFRSRGHTWMKTQTWLIERPAAVG